MDDPSQITIPEEISKEQISAILKNLLEVYTHNPEQAKKDHEYALKGPREGRLYAPYYTRKTAEKVKPLLDRLIIEQVDLFLYAKDFNCASSTLYMKIYHGWLYVCDKLDTEGKKYFLLRRKIEMKRVNNGVLFKWKNKELNKDSCLADKAVAKTPEIESAIWQSRLLDFLEEGQVGHKFTLKGLNLSEEEVINVQGILSEYPSKIISHVDNTEILVIKLPEDYEANANQTDTGDGEGDTSIPEREEGD